MKNTNRTSTVVSINLASITQNLRTRGLKHEAFARTASTAGNITDTTFHAGVATSLSEFADACEQEAGE